MFLGAVFRVAVVAALVLVSTALPAQATANECVPGEVQVKPWYERYMWLMTGGVLVLGLLGSLLVFRRRHNREVSDD